VLILFHRLPFCISCVDFISLLLEWFHQLNLQLEWIQAADGFSQLRLQAVEWTKQLIWFHSCVCKSSSNESKQLWFSQSVFANQVVEWIQAVDMWFSQLRCKIKQLKSNPSSWYGLTVAFCNRWNATKPLIWFQSRLQPGAVGMNPSRWYSFTAAFASPQLKWFPSSWFVFLLLISIFISYLFSHPYCHYYSWVRVNQIITYTNNGYTVRFFVVEACEFQPSAFCNGYQKLPLLAALFALPSVEEVELLKWRNKTHKDTDNFVTVY
jgi:hypothetical protein